MPGSPDSTADPAPPADPRGTAGAGWAAAELVEERRGRLHPAVARTREAVRAGLVDLPRGTNVLVACSGGADSLALAAATAFEAPRLGLRAGAVIVDHGLQADSAHIAGAAAATARELGLEPVLVRRVEVTGEGGPEASARSAR